MPRIGVVTFPGTLDEQDALRAVRVSGAEAVSLWHDSEGLDGVDAVILPGGSSYGGYLRAGALASLSPIMGDVIEAAGRGVPVLGISDGFQVLCEAGLLDGALLRNADQQFVCRDQRVRVDSIDSVWTCAYTRGDELTMVFKNGHGNFQADEETLRRLEDGDQVVLRWLDNPNGSANDIAGITNSRGNVVGLMVSPEHCIDELTGPSTDGNGIFASALEFLSLRD